MGSKITKLKPVGGFCAEAAGAITLFGTALAGIPVSTTHTITGAIIGVGTTNRISAVRWGIARRIVWAWVLDHSGVGDRRHGGLLADQDVLSHSVGYAGKTGFSLRKRGRAAGGKVGTADPLAAKSHANNRKSGGHWGP